MNVAVASTFRECLKSDTEGSSYTTGIIISGYSLETKSEWRVPRNDGTGWIRECVYPNNPIDGCSEFNARS